jgi:hypothetical protein
MVLFELLIVENSAERVLFKNLQPKIKTRSYGDGHHRTQRIIYVYTCIRVFTSVCVCVCVCVRVSSITIGVKGLYPHVSHDKDFKRKLYCSQFFFLSQEPLSIKIKVTKWVYLENIPQTIALEQKNKKKK